MCIQLSKFIGFFDSSKKSFHLSSKNQSSVGVFLKNFFIFITFLSEKEKAVTQTARTEERTFILSRYSYCNYVTALKFKAMCLLFSTVQATDGAFFERTVLCNCACYYIPSEKYIKKNLSNGIFIFLTGNTIGLKYNLFGRIICKKSFRKRVK